MGLDDFLVAHRADALRKLIDAAGPAEQPACPMDGRPEIEVTPDEHLVNDEAIEALAKRDDGIYQRAGMLVRIVQDGNDPAKIRRRKAPYIDPIPPANLRDRLTKSAWLYVRKTGKDGEEKQVQVHPPAWLVHAVHRRGSWNGIRSLEIVVEHPVMMRDGSILQKPGYDPASGILLMPRGELPAVPENPSRADAIQAALRLIDVVEDFPFRGEADRSAWLASLLTILARPAFDGPSPLFLGIANTRGAGKGLLFNTGAIIATGEPHTMTAWPKDEDELRKRVTSWMIAGERIAIFDNLTGPIGNGTLDCLLTSEAWGDRILGVNQHVKLPMLLTVFATGNNVQIAADTCRRICPIRLNTPLERPEDRQGFKIPNLLAHVRKHRAELLVDALTILRAYFIAGRPGQKMTPWGSFEGWDSVVRSAPFGSKLMTRSRPGSYSKTRRTFPP